MFPPLSFKKTAWKTAWNAFANVLVALRSKPMKGNSDNLWYRMCRISCCGCTVGTNSEEGNFAKRVAWAQI